MKQHTNRTPSLKLLCVILMSSITSVATANIGIPETPLLASQTFTPMTMLVTGKDHKLFYEAYNDASDIDGDGVLDVRFKPAITYYGLFDSSLCYDSGGSDSASYFKPVAKAVGGVCNKKWSGNFLNYITTSRIDALRKVLYGGQRDVDSTTQTILRRAYIPQDAHSWAKEYTSESVDGYKISDYTPLSQPTNNKRHFFGNLTETADVNCKTLTDCSGKPPMLHVITNSSKRVWEWASTERPVLSNSTHGGARARHTVRVEVCTDTYHAECKKYPNGKFKPIGLLHEYGEDGSMLFGMLSGSYNKNMSGGVLRKVVSSFSTEVNSNTGQFSSSATIVNAFNSLRIRDFNNDTTGNQYRGGWETAKPMTEGQFVDWGNPIGEMIYETLRYFAGKGSATPAFATTGGHDEHVGLPVATWDNPYASNSAAKAPWCAKPNIVTISDINPSFDSDQLPGSSFSSFSGDLSGMNVSTLADTITQNESNIVGQRFIGQSGALDDKAPTPKTITSLSNIRGLAPEEPTKQGSYYSASAAYYGKITDLNEVKGVQNTDTYVVALASPLPKIEIKTSKQQTVTLVPFAKSVSGSSISNKKGDFQPTNQIVDFYVDTIANTGTTDSNPNINGGRYYAKFRINYEDVEQGADHDMDAIAEYEIKLLSDDSISVKVTPIYQAGGIRQNMGYVLSGTTSDGVYLVVQDENVETSYYLNVPPGFSPGQCDVADPNKIPNACKKLPYTQSEGGTGPFHSERTFVAGGSAATLLKDPLWYAAKWGGFVDQNNNQRPDLPLEWDADNDGVPDTYFLVQNPLSLKAALKKSFNTIVEKSASSGNLAVNSTSITTSTAVFQSTYDTKTWTGDLRAFELSGNGVGVAKWKASDQLPISRTIVTSNNINGVSFSWSDLTKAQQTTLGSQSILEYIRGDRTKEISQGGTLRTRTSLIGDIVHSSPYYVKDTDTVYVGANDGMLHAFDASTGTELFAYIPSTLFSKLATLADPNYTHTYFVDGEVAVSTRNQTPNKNILVGAPGRGAKGLYALNVTSPGTFSPSNVLWEYTETDDIALDNSIGSGDLGFILGQPVIAKLNNGSMAVIVGNGYNSTNGDAVLFIFDLETGALIKKLAAGAAGNNGLATPTVFDEDGDGAIDYIYAGDLQGNVWKYVLKHKTNTENWDFAYKASGKPAPLFTAKDSNGTTQPITAPLTVTVNLASSGANAGKTFVFFGTGSYMANGDPTNLAVQSWYGLVDDGVISGRSQLKQRSFVINESSVLKGNLPVIIRSIAKADADNDDMLNKKGWYLDLADPSPRGERIVSRSILINALKPVLEVASIIPVVGDPCDAQGDGFINFIDPFTGAQLSFVFIDVNGDGKFDDNDKIDGEYPSSINPGVGMPGEPVLVGRTNVVGGTSGKITTLNKNFGGKQITGRMSWREIIKE